MKTLVAMWTFGWVLVILGSVNSDTIVYPGRSALLAYNPARGEFPVQSLFGRGYFSYIDESGNSRIVALEPNPLLGVRVSDSGLSPVVIGRNIKLNKKTALPDAAPHDRKDNQKPDRLKPIKEFDQNPFVDSLDQNEKIVSSTLAPGSSRIVLGNPSLNQNALPTAASTGPQGQPLLYLPPTTGPMSVLQSTAGARQIFSKPPAPGLYPGNPFLSPSPLAVNPTRLPTSSALPPINSETVVPSTSLPVAPEIVFPNNPLLSILQEFYPDPLPLAAGSPSTPLAASTPPKGNTCSASEITPPTPSPASVFPNLPPASSQGVFINPTPPPASSQGVFVNPSPSPYPGNPFLANKQDRPISWTPPSAAVPTPQFNADKKNPFLPNIQRSNLSPEFPTVQPTVTQFGFNSSDSRQEISSTATIPLTEDPAAPLEQIKDTPEVEQAKREHFLAYELALAQLKTARQHSDDKLNDSSSPLALASDSSSVYSLADEASHQAVTSESSTIAYADQTKLAGAISDAVLQAQPVV